MKESCFNKIKLIVRKFKEKNKFLVLLTLLHQESTRILNHLLNKFLLEVVLFKAILIKAIKVPNNNQEQFSLRKQHPSFHIEWCQTELFQNLHIYNHKTKHQETLYLTWRILDIQIKTPHPAHLKLSNSRQYFQTLKKEVHHKHMHIHKECKQMICLTHLNLITNQRWMQQVQTLICQL